VKNIANDLLYTKSTRIDNMNQPTNLKRLTRTHKNTQYNPRFGNHHKGVLLLVEEPTKGRVFLSHPVLEGKSNANYVRARISNSRTQQLHNMDIITQCSNSIKKREIVVDYIICLRHPHSLYNKSKCENEM
jgi:hypothetical protein